MEFVKRKQQFWRKKISTLKPQLQLYFSTPSNEFSLAMRKELNKGFKSVRSEDMPVNE